MAEYERFWKVAEQAMEQDPTLERGTIMGMACLRTGGKFVAGPWHDGIVVKLNRARVQEVMAGGGLPFAPAGKVFREWVVAPTAREELWPELIEEAARLARAAD